MAAIERQALKSDREIAELHARLRVLDRERQELQKRLAELTSPPHSVPGLHSSEQINGEAGQARRSKARFVLGLSATVARKDGHQPIVFMQCGPVRYRVDAKAQAKRRGFEHRVQVRGTGFQLPIQLQGQERMPMPELYAALAADEARNTLNL